ncbi:MAG: response regulator transcription factor [Muribaculaceae bacterium]|nr:response regulator transcription factor [Muribaculaceae bacterium]
MGLVSDIANTQQERLLIIDTEQMICELLQYKFEDAGFKVDIAHDGHKALDTLPIPDYSLILVDLMDAPFTGLQLTEQLKRSADTYTIPVIIMSATKSEDDVVEALDAGADDYISKPFSTRELIARVRSVLRRRRMMSGRRRMSNVLQYRTLTLDIGQGSVAIDGQPVNLSRTEFLILAMFLRHKNQFFDRAEIQHEAWEDEKEVSDRAVDTNISRLRKKIAPYGRNIVNRHGFGYGFME